MKALTCQVILTGASTRADGSLGLRLATPELTPDEKTAIFELQNKNMKMLLQPIDDQATELKEVRAVLDCKTPCQRLRAVLFVEFRQTKPDMTFDEFYVRRMDKLIERVKEKLNPA